MYSHCMMIILICSITIAYIVYMQYYNCIYRHYCIIYLYYNCNVAMIQLCIISLKIISKLNFKNKDFIITNAYFEK